MIKLPVGKDGFKVFLDDRDDWISKWKWTTWQGKRNKIPRAVRGIRKPDGSTYQLHMSRFIAGALPDEKCEFLNGNSLDCRRENLLIDGICVLDLKRESITETNYEQYLSIFI